VSGDGQLGLVTLRRFLALDEQGAVVGDHDSGAQAVGAALRGMNDSDASIYSPFAGTNFLELHYVKVLENSAGQLWVRKK
jgi:hypothetical protein